MKKTTCVDCDNTAVIYYILPGWSDPVPMCAGHEPDWYEKIAFERGKIYKLEIKL